MADRTIVCIIREDAPQQVSELGVVLNRFLGFVRIRYLERVRGKTALRVGRRVDSIPENLCRTVREQSGEKKAPSGEPACGDLVEVDWDSVEAALSLPVKKQHRVPAVGTLSWVHRVSSPTPATSLNVKHMVKLTGQGRAKTLTTVCQVPKAVYLGEVLGTALSPDEIDPKNRRHFAVRKVPTHDLAGNSIIYTGLNKYKVDRAVDTSEAANSSLVHYVPTASPGGPHNAEYIQCQDRIFLRTAASIPAGTRVVAKPHYPFSTARKQLLQAARLRKRARVGGGGGGGGAAKKKQQLLLGAGKKRPPNRTLCVPSVEDILRSLQAPPPAYCPPGFEW